MHPLQNDLPLILDIGCLGVFRVVAVCYDHYKTVDIQCACKVLT